MRPITLLLLAACAADTTTVPAPVPAPPPAPAAAAAAVERRDLVLDPAELRWDDEAGVVWFTPGSRARAAAYTRYALDAASVEAAVGRPTEPVAVVVEVALPADEAVVQDEPDAARPEGGIRVTTWTGRVLTGR